MKIITSQILNELTAKAQKSARQRMNLNYHDELSDTLQRLLNAMEPGTYVQPHKHENPDKRELFLILRGKAIAITFDDHGKIKDHITLDVNNNQGVEIPEHTWHTIIVLEKGTVLFEVKDGPYEAISDKNFASWAPKEGEPGCKAYMNKLLDEINIFDKEKGTFFL
jgi:cupin fold WbuC family metalloprotein